MYTCIFQKKNFFLKMYCQMFLNIKNFEKWSDNFIKNQKISKNALSNISKKIRNFPNNISKKQKNTKNVL